MHKKEHGFGIVEILIIIVVIGLLGFIGLQVYAGIREKSNDTSSDQKQASSAASSSEENKDQTKSKRRYGLHGSFLAYQLTHKTYPPATPEGWQAIVDMPHNGDPAERYTDVTDPHTGTVYKFTSDTPEYGEIQYRQPASCDGDYKDFAPAKTKDNYAFRLKYSTGVQCSTNL